MSKIIYIHHYFSKSLFYKIAHNTTDREYHIDDTNTGYIIAKYKNNEIKFIFDPTIHYSEDGLHLVDFFSVYYQKNLNPNFKDLIIRDTITDISFLTRVEELTKNNKNWIILFMRMEKIFGKYEDDKIPFVVDLEEKLKNLNNNIIITDNIFLNEPMENVYSNHFFCLTNSLHQWNEYISIRWYYEYKNIFEKLNQPYDLCFSMRHHKKNRIDIINELSKLNNNKIYLSRVDNSKGKEFNQLNNLFEENIHYNITKGNDFEDINWLQNVGEYQYLDYLMRILPMAKMHILSETWDYKSGNYTSNYLSEKTYGFLLANIPFISTHSYPLEIIQKILKIKNHPFYDEIELINGNPKKFAEFVKIFMDNFDKNYFLCKEWVNIAHNKLMENLNSENSLFNLILINFYSKEKIKKNLL